MSTALDLFWADHSFSFNNYFSSKFVLFRTDSKPVGVFLAAKIEKLARGDPIYPPCDRCRRLKFECTKHLTACSACTKKHAKCSWKDIKEGERSYSRNSPLPIAHQFGFRGTAPLLPKLLSFLDIGVLSFAPA